jgi:tRNA 2-thiocytidine biosynthesis protein TtcA
MKHVMKLSETRKATRLVGKAIGDFSLIRDGDRILVALSGGKDSWSLLYILLELQRKAPVKYDVGAVTIHPGYRGFETASLEDRLCKDSVLFDVIRVPIKDIITEKLEAGTSPCSFCARLRRGIIYSHAAGNGWNKIALGHHLDDFVETLLLNLFFNGSIKGMNPFLSADDGCNTVIRPLVYVKEELTRRCAELLRVPILSCSCPFVGMLSARRKWVKGLIADLEQDVPDLKTTLLSAMGRVHYRHLFANSVLFGGRIDLVKREAECSPEL